MQKLKMEYLTEKAEGLWQGIKVGFRRTDCKESRIGFFRQTDGTGGIDTARWKEDLWRVLASGQ